MPSPLWPLLQSFSVQEFRHHPWRNLAAAVAVVLGVALAFSVHLINASALDEFSQALRSVSGQADLEVQSNAASADGLDLSVLALLQQQPQIALASPVLELSTYAWAAAPAGQTPTRQTLTRVPLRIIGVDALLIARLAPDLTPLPDPAHTAMAVLAPGQLFLNAPASQALGNGSVSIQQGMQLQTAQVAGSVRASGAALAVMDIGAAQDFFQKSGLSRVDIRLQPGTDRQALVQRLQASPGWSAEWTLSVPGDAAQRVGNLSRAYRVNLTVLALVALFTGGFLVFSVLAQSVSRRAQQFALLGVLGLTGRQRLQLVLLEATALGVLGSVLGLVLGTGLAALALRLLGGDLGGGYFSGSAPPLQWKPWAAALFGSMGVATALAGAGWPAQQVRQLPAAQTLKGLGSTQTQRSFAGWGPALLLCGALLALLPPIAGMALAAYLSVALILLGGIVCLPWLVGWLLDGVAPLVAQRALPLLAVERARRVRHSASVAVSGVVAALSLAVALTVMVSSFRHSVTAWLDTVLPAALYVRSGMGSATELAYLEPAYIAAAAQLPQVQRIALQRTLPLKLDASKPSVALLVRSLRSPEQAGLDLPLVGDALPVPAGQIGIYVSEAMLDLYAARPGGSFPLLQKIFPRQQSGTAPTVFFVAGVWRDYARQFGSIAMDRQDYARLRDDPRSNDMAVWLKDGADASSVEQQLRTLADQMADQLTHTPQGGASALLEFHSAAQIRNTTLRIFDRSFAVTYWLQAVAVGIGLFGVAASFSAQVLARRKEFGLLAHLGLTRRQILTVVAAEGAAWTLLGALAGMTLGLAVAVVLVHVVNPQSFHWTMQLSVPWWRLLALAAAVVVAGTLTAGLAGRAAAGRDAVMAVKEDW